MKIKRFERKEEKLKLGKVNSFQMNNKLKESIKNITNDKDIKKTERKKKLQKRKKENCSKKETRKLERIKKECVEQNERFSF